MAALSESDRVRTRHHLGYLNIEPGVSISFGFPSAQQPEFLVERAMNNVIDQAVGRIIATLDTLDCIEDKLRSSIEQLAVQQLGELKLRNNNDEQNVCDLLEREYVRWAKRLADDLGAPLNVFSERFRATGGTMGTVPVAWWT